MLSMVAMSLTYNDNFFFPFKIEILAKGIIVGHPVLKWGLVKGVGCTIKHSVWSILTSFLTLLAGSVIIHPSDKVIGKTLIIKSAGE